mmetsp:Transcript_53364/g.133984  ORF Transcript_53364/g.133984 Transcript_53364/m.133984 type:complete len:165 (-) Transcript_53364:39-533(-)
MSAADTVDFIQTYGFVGGSGSGGGRAKMMEFNYIRTLPDGTDLPMKISVPLLAIIPIPCLRITEFNFNFNANLESTDIKSVSNAVGIRMDAEASYTDWSTTIPITVGFGMSVSASLEMSSGQKVERTFNLECAVKAEQGPYPPGVKHVLEVMTQAISHQFRKQA